MNGPYDDYLSALSRPLVGVLPGPLIRRIEDEAQSHLEAIQESLVFGGMPTDEAVRVAMTTFGDPGVVAKQHLAVYLAGSRRGTWMARLGWRNASTFVAVGQASFLALALVTLRVVWPSESPISAGVGRAVLHMKAPFSFTLADGHPTSIALLALMGLAPFLIGAVVGRLSPYDAASTIMVCCLGASAVTTLVGFQTLPNPEPLILALTQAVYWGPCGAIVAHLVSRLHWRRSSAAHRLREPETTPVPTSTA